MAWGVKQVQEQRKKFCILVGSYTVSFSEACRQFEISRKTGYKWKKRFEEQGDLGLIDQSRAPNIIPHKTDPLIVDLIVNLRCKYPTCGAKPIKKMLENQFPALEIPSVATIENILNINGLTYKRRKRPRLSITDPLSHCSQPNDVWTADFKGWFYTGDNQKCGPFTLMDASSRYLLKCESLKKDNTEHVWGVIDAALREFGVPKAFRSDNGPPFASVYTPGRISKLSINLIKAGIKPEWISPGKPEENGRHERFHRTFSEHIEKKPEATLVKQIQKIHEFKSFYNEVRPHSSIGMQAPESVYHKSSVTWDGRLRSPEYDSDYEVRKVHSCGKLHWKNSSIYISRIFENEPVGIIEVDNDLFEVYYGPVFLGRINESQKFSKEEIKPRRSSQKR